MFSEKSLKRRVSSNLSPLELQVSIGQGCMLKFLPPYSPDMNPIEESFSAGESDGMAVFTDQ